MCVCVCVCVCACVRVCACVHACVHACVKSNNFDECIVMFLDCVHVTIISCHNFVGLYTTGYVRIPGEARGY